MALSPLHDDDRSSASQQQGGPAVFGSMIPLGGGDPIPLIKKKLLIGRRESCDVVLRFANVSAHHCELFINGGYWYVRDLKSCNGIKINALLVNGARINPNDIFSISSHEYEFHYSPSELGAVGPPPDDVSSDIFRRSLLDRAGLENDPRK